MAPWIMHSEVRRHPWRLTFSIGQVPIAQIDFDNKKPYLHTLDTRVQGPFDSVSAAMKRMHEMLNNPPVIKEPETDERT